MTITEIVRQRLVNHQIADSKFRKPGEIVSWLGAMQAQDFAMAKWAIGLRLPYLNENDIEKSFNEGDILRTHLLRPTWHFVTPADIRWMLALTAPRVNALNAYWYRKFELDFGIFKRCNDVLAKTLQGGKQLTRAALKVILGQKKIVADGLRLSYLFMRAELDGIMCSGPREGKQFTYALLDEKVPLRSNESAHPDREQSLAELARRYFASRGPATLHDFVYWSGLTMNDAKVGAAMLETQLSNKSIDGQDYYFLPSPKENKNRGASIQNTFLLPDYDEYGISYKNRSALLNSKNALENISAYEPYSHMIIVDGVIAGTWQRIVKNNSITVETLLFDSLSKTKQIAVINAVKRYCTFSGKVAE